MCPCSLMPYAALKLCDEGGLAGGQHNTKATTPTGSGPCASHPCWCAHNRLPLGHLDAPWWYWPINRGADGGAAFRTEDAAFVRRSWSRPTWLQDRQVSSVWQTP